MNGDLAHMNQTLANAGEGTAGLYETLPYDSMPFAHTQPSNLAALATLFGHRPPPVTDCRVLDLGCASGGNIVPLAARFPKAQFTGIDLSRRHVDIGRERIAALGLANIAIRQGDLADPDVVTGEYDYIICHGVYSWVPPAAQHGIFNICSKHLAPNGVAYISYNVLPGWQLRKIIRDIFQFHSGDIANPGDRVARGRWLLEQLATVSSETTPYGQLLRREAKQLAALPDSYILGEFLAADNAPCYFHEFLERAEQAGLAYLTDTDLHTSLPENISPELDQALVALAGPDADMTEQYFDFFQGRQFRQSLLIKAKQAPSFTRKVDHRRIAHLHFSSNLRLDPQRSTDHAMVLRDPGGPTITTNDPFVAKALDFLGASSPESRSLKNILDHLGIKRKADREAATERVMGSMLRVIIAGFGTMSAVPVKLGRAADAKPKVWSVARHDRLADQPWTTNLKHMPVKLDAIANALLPHVDGRNDRASLAADLLALVKAGALDAHATQSVVDVSATGDAAAAKVAARVEQVLQQLEHFALLEPMR